MRSFASQKEDSVIFDESSLHKKRDYIVQESTMFEGRPVSHSVMKVDDPDTRFKGLNAIDFSLENQNAVGLQLDPVKLNPSRSVIENQFEKHLNNVDNEKE